MSDRPPIMRAPPNTLDERQHSNGSDHHHHHSQHPTLLETRTCSLTRQSRDVRHTSLAAQRYLYRLRASITHDPISPHPKHTRSSTSSSSTNSTNSGESEPQITNLIVKLLKISTLSFDRVMRGIAAFSEKLDSDVSIALHATNKSDKQKLVEVYYADNGGQILTHYIAQHTISYIAHESQHHSHAGKPPSHPPSSGEANGLHRLPSVSSPHGDATTPTDRVSAQTSVLDALPYTTVYDRMCSLIRLALSLTAQIDGMHTQKLTVNSLSPYTILYNDAIARDTPQVMFRTVLCDSSRISMIERELYTVNDSSTVFESYQLPYISPEQTGRVSRPVDRRSDLYALGAVLFHAAAGRPPFLGIDHPTGTSTLLDDADTTASIIHSHLARPAPRLIALTVDSAHQATDKPAYDQLASVQRHFSDIVHKLLAKAPEDRYQSAAGLKTDLAFLHTSLTRKQTASHSPHKLDTFTIGTADFDGSFQVSQKLYGRQQAITDLLNAFDRVAGKHGDPSKGVPELVLVTGYSGVGKTSVVNEIYKPVTRQRGMFIRGKFDVYQRHISCLLQSFSSLLLQVLSQSPARQSYWREQLRTRLGSEGKVLTDVLPNLEQLIGPQPPVESIEPSDAQRRFEKVLIAFVMVFSNVTHPLVIFLDDLQWVDAMSLHLLTLLHRQTDCHLLIIGAYRDNEVSESHPLMQAIDKLTGADVHRTDTTSAGVPSANALTVTGSRVTTLCLAPLRVDDITQLVSDTFHVNQQTAQPFAALLHTHSAGNPFHVSQLLSEYYNRGAVRYDYDSLKWGWEMSELVKSDMPADVVELLCTQIGKLPATSRQALKYGAVLGNSFQLSTLAAVMDIDIPSVSLMVWPCLQQGLLMTQGSTSVDLYIEASAHADSDANDTLYSQPDILTDMPTTPVFAKTLDIESPSEVHPAISAARTLAIRFGHDKIQAAAYSLIHQNELKAMHLAIARQLYATRCNQASLDTLVDITSHYNQGASLITDPAECKLVTELNVQAGQHAMTATQFDTAKSLLTFAYTNLPRVASKSDLWNDEYYPLTYGVYHNLAEVSIVIADFDTVKQLVKETLENSRVRLHCASMQQLLVILSSTQNRLEDAVSTGIEALAQLGITLETPPDELDLDSLKHQLYTAAPVTDAECMLAMRILTSMVAALFALQRIDMYRKTAYTCIVLSIKHGVSGATAHGLIILGVSYVEGGQLQRGYEIGRIGFELVEKLPTEWKQLYAAKCHQAYGITLHHWNHPMRSSLSILADAVSAGVRGSDVEYTGHSLWAYMETCLFLDALTLPTLQKVSQAILATLEQRRLMFQLGYTVVWCLAIQKLTMVEVDKFTIQGVEKTEADLESELKAQSNAMVQFSWRVSNAWLSWLSGRPADAVDHCVAAHPHRLGGAGFYSRLIILFIELVSRIQLLELPSNAEDDRPLLDDLLIQSLPETVSSTIKAEADATLGVCERLYQQLQKYVNANTQEYQSTYDVATAMLAQVHIFVHRRFDLIMPTIQMFDNASRRLLAAGRITLAAYANEQAAVFHQRLGNYEQSHMYYKRSYGLHKQHGNNAGMQYLERTVQLSFDLFANPIEMTLTLEQQYGRQAVYEQIMSMVYMVGSPTAQARSGGTQEITGLPAPSTTPENGSPVLPQTQDLSASAVDFSTIMRAAQTFSVETDINKLLSRLLLIVLQHANATRGHLLLLSEDTPSPATTPTDNEDRVVSNYIVDVTASADVCLGNDVECQHRDTAGNTGLGDIAEYIPSTVFNLVRATSQYVLLPSKQYGVETMQQILETDQYFQSHNRPRTILCLPITASHRLMGLLYLENDFAVSAFHASHIQVLHLLCSQASQSIENAKLHMSLRAAKLTAEQAAASKSEFLANMSHELRTPLNAVIGVSRLLSATQLSDEQQQYVAIVTNSSNLLLSVINDILNYSKIDSGGMQLEALPYSLHDAVEQAVHLCYPLAAEKGLSISYDVDDQLPASVIGDMVRVQQILLNLLSNAIKFCASGYIAVELHHVISNAAATDGGVVSVMGKVIDTGIGISQEIIARLFNPFVQADSSTSRQFGGTGLGLTIARRLVQMHGGDVTIASQVGVGSTFSFTLNLQVDTNEQTQLQYQTSSNINRPARFVYIVSTSTRSAKMYSNFCKHVQTESTVVTDVTEVLKVLTAPAAASDTAARIILLDCDSHADLTKLRSELARVIQSSAAMPPVGVLYIISPTASQPVTSPTMQQPNSAMPCITLELRKPVRRATFADAVESLYGMLLDRIESSQSSKASVSPTSADSAPGIGTLTRGRTGSTTPQQRASTKGSIRSIAHEMPLRLMLAEDNRVNQKLMTAYMSKLGYKLTIANNGEEALAMVESHHIGTDIDFHTDNKHFAVWLMDVSMDVMDGLTCTKRIRQHEAQCPLHCYNYIVAQTASVNLRTECKLAGANEFITKPIGLEALIAALKSAYQYYVTMIQ